MQRQVNDSQTTNSANGTLPQPASLRFRDGRPMVQVDEEVGCWIWLGARSKGYGKVSRGGRNSVQAHKWLYESIFGPVSNGYELGHVCHRRSCVYPLHVRPVLKIVNKREQYSTPSLSSTTRKQIEERLLEDKTNSTVADEFGLSCWAIRKISHEMKWKNQLSLRGLPF